MMVKRKCLNCGAENYSADTFNKYWICCKCGCKILKTQEKPITGGNKDEILGYNCKDDNINNFSSRNFLHNTKSDDTRYN